ncbi:hypothetical protein PMKS-000060 [Pichia membranifaciens]|uniref:Magnesium transporter n=1 Tax=Pichia membranifaciens TaxID=4926 RepID=A0A1Q2YAN3_9ASCO|nr:hypothetical protein PMKS-000060 [Pichia membranifaciens]
MTMTDSTSNSASSESSISVSSSNDEPSVHSTISGESILDDHRHQNQSLPIRTESRLLAASQEQQLPLAAVQEPVLEHSEGAAAYEGSMEPDTQYFVHPTKTKKKGPGRMKARTNSQCSVGSSRPVPPMPEKPSKVNINSNVNSRDLLNRMVADDEYDEYAVKFNDSFKNSNNINFASNSTTPAPLVIPARRNSATRTKSFSEQVKSLIRPREESVSGGILLGSNSNSNNNTFPSDEEFEEKGKAGNKNSFSHANAILDNVSNDSASMRRLSHHSNNLVKVPSRASSRSTRKKMTREGNDADSDVDSHASRESQETEEDVCFPMLPEHVRIRGIDFDEIEEFIVEQREENERIAEREKELRMGCSNSITTSSEKISSAALKYIPKHFNSRTGNSSSDLSDKSLKSEKDHYDSTSTNNNLNNYDSGTGKFENVTFNPEGNKQEEEYEEADLPTRFSFFSSEMEETIHAADIPSLVGRGHPFKELFEPEDSIWWLDCTCPTDSEMKMLAKAFSIHPLTAEDIRMQETREKVELFKSYYFVSFHTFETDSESEDFLEPINVYIVVFKSGILTFHFSPIVNPANVRRRVRQLRDYVNVSSDWLCYAMIDDITDGFAPIIQSIEYEADAIEDSVFLSRENDFGRMLLKIGESRRKVMTLMRLLQGKADVIKMFAKRCQDEAASRRINGGTNNNNSQAQPSADIALYLGDIQDHIITMFQSLLSYEKIFSRSHSNYLAQLQVESFYSNLRVTDMLSKVTLLGTILVPMNLVTGLFGMNVKVPGNGQSDYGWFGGIIGFIFFLVLALVLGASYYLKYVERNASSQVFSSGISMKSFGFGRKKNKQHTGGGSGRDDAVSLPTRFTRYGDW